MFNFKIGWHGISYHGEHPVRDGLAIGVGGGFAMTGIYGAYRGVKYIFDKLLPTKRQTININQQEISANSESDTDKTLPTKRNVYTSDEIFSEIEHENHDWILDGFIRPGQISFLVGGGSSGKSIIMTDMAIASSNGLKPSLLPDNCLNSMTLDVLVYRLEVFSQELQGKYGKGKVLKQSNIGWRKVDELSSYSVEGLIDAFKQDASSITKPTVIIADPVTKLPGYNHKSFIAGAEEAMKIANERGIPLSIVASAHLDEIENWKSVSSSDIKGGDILFQQAGAVIALCKARGGENYRFLKCLKPAKGSPIPYEGKVVIIKSVKMPMDEENWYVKFIFDSIKEEKEALPYKTKSEITKNQDDLEEELQLEKIRIFKEMWLDPQFSKQQIAEELKVSTRTLQRWREDLGLPDRNVIKRG